MAMRRKNALQETGFVQRNGELTVCRPDNRLQRTVMDKVMAWTPSSARHHSTCQSGSVERPLKPRGASESPCMPPRDG